MSHPAQRVASVMSVRPVSRWAPMARLRIAAMTRGPERVCAVESSSRQTTSRSQWRDSSDQWQVHRLEATPVILHEFQAAETVLRLGGVCERAWRAGAFTEEAGRAWLGRLERCLFLASLVLFTAVGSTEPVSE
jgi:hypothetical protein